VNYWPITSLNPGGTVIFWDDNRAWVYYSDGTMKVLKADHVMAVVNKIVNEVLVRRLTCA
jgi:hypothetical protein